MHYSLNQKKTFSERTKQSDNTCPKITDPETIPKPPMQQHLETCEEPDAVAKISSTV